ncbi:MAG: hypothetical protein V2A34_02460 [Lentisphaerota bacterium]
MSIDRTTIVKGPAIVTFDSEVMYVKDAITLNYKLDTFEIPVSTHGSVDQRISNVPVEISFTPVGKWDALSQLFPHTTPAPGDSIFGATDKNLTIQTKAGVLITCKAAAVTKMPDIISSTTKTLLGQVTFTCIGVNNTAWTDAAKRLLVASNAWSDTSFSPADVLTQTYAIAWGSASPWSTIKTMDGVTISFGLKTSPIETDEDGLVDMCVDDVSVSAKLTPVGVSETQLVDLLKGQGTGAVRGASLATINSNALNISGTGVYVRIYAAVPKETPMAFERAKNRAGSITFEGVRTVATGVLQPLFYVGAAAPT